MHSDKQSGGQVWALIMNDNSTRNASESVLCPSQVISNDQHR